MNFIINYIKIKMEKNFILEDLFEFLSYKCISGTIFSNYNTFKSFKG